MMMVSKDPLKVFKILLVEDNQADVGLTEYFLGKSRFPIQLKVAQDGEEALKALHESSSFEAREDPDLILLDLSLPKIDGRKVLTAIKTNFGLKHIPVFILTGSNAPQDLDLARLFKADGYIVKPSKIKDYIEVLLKQIEDFLAKTYGEPV